VSRSFSPSHKVLSPSSAVDVVLPVCTACLAVHPGF
jgi:hypothetical protein